MVITWWRHPACFQNSWNALDRNFPYTLPEACQPRMNFPDLRLLSFDQFLEDLFLLSNDRAVLHSLKNNFTFEANKLFRFGHHKNLLVNILKRDILFTMKANCYLNSV